MKRLLILTFWGIFLSLLLSSYAPYPLSIQSNSSTSEVYFNPKKYELEVLKYINKVRQNPKAFYKNYVKDYIKKYPDRFTAYYTHSLKKDLNQLPPLPPLSSDKYLQQIARKQLNYLTHTLKGKKLVHNQGVLSFRKRIENISYHAFAENLYRAQKDSPLALVLDLLIDQGIRNLGHRKNILSPKYESIGIQSGKAKNGYILTVMDFGKK